MSSFLERLLAYYEWSKDTYQSFIQPATSHQLVAFTSYPEHATFLTTISTHLAAGHRMLIYGDYDADGMFSSAILYETLTTLNAKVDVYLPQRYQDGYGITLTQMQRAHHEGYALVICIDNGVSQHEALTYAKNVGIDVLVMDHHGCPETLPPMKALIHPEKDHPHPLARCSGSLALSFSMHMHQSLLPTHLIYAAIATMTDSMPLIKDNRALVQLGIEAINSYIPLSLQPFIQQFPLDENSLSMMIGPIFNAIGRIMKDDTIQTVVPYLVSKDRSWVQETAIRFNEINQLRKRRSDDAVKAWEKDTQHYLIEKIEEVSGLTGLIASKLVMPSRPIVGIFAQDEKHPDHLVGSLRSIDGIDIRQWLQAYQGPLIAFGGHAQACGVTVHQDYFQALKSYLKMCPINQNPPPKKTLVISTRDLTFENLQMFQALKPFGPGSEEPLLQIHHVPVNKLTFSKKPPFYLSTSLTPYSSVFSFKLTRADFIDETEVILEGRMRLNNYLQRRIVQFVADRFLAL